MSRVLFVTGVALGIFNQEFHAVAEANPDMGAESVKCDLALAPGLSVSVAVIGPDGKPLTGTLVRGVDYPDSWDNRPAKAAQFTVQDVKPEEPRLLQFLHPEKKLAGSIIVRGNEKSLPEVRLQPAAVLTGRFVTTDGKPLANLSIYAITMPPLATPNMRVKPDVTAGSFPGTPLTDKDGKFRIEGLAPGLTYKLGILRGMFGLQPEGEQANGVTLKAGETKDLGDLKIKLPGED